METIFKEGDKVFDARYGWGEVYLKVESYTWPILVDFGNFLCSEYTLDGRAYDRCQQVLSFTEYTLKGFSQERPEELPKKGDIVWIRGEFPSEWTIGHFFNKINDKYYTCPHPNLGGWSDVGIEIRTTNPYEHEKI